MKNKDFILKIKAIKFGDGSYLNKKDLLIFLQECLINKRSLNTIIEAIKESEFTEKE